MTSLALRHSSRNATDAPELVDAPAGQTVDSVTALKQCTIAVSVTHTANGMAGKVSTKEGGEDEALSAIAMVCWCVHAEATT